MGGRETDDLEGFLRRHKLEPGRVATHTRFGDGSGSYYIPQSEQDEFFAVYSRAVLKRVLEGGSRAIGLVERHRDFGPVVIDIDLRYKATTADFIGGAGTPPERRYTLDDVKSFLHVYVTVLAQWVSLPPEVTIVTMSKRHPSADKGVVKDGVHIVLPDVVTDPLLQRLVRKDVVAMLGPGMFRRPGDGAGPINSPEDIFDEAVIHRNGWMMFGSSKSGQDPYQVVMVQKARMIGPLAVFEEVRDAGKPSGPASWRPRDLSGVEALVRLMSIRNKGSPLPPVAERVPAVTDMREAEQRVAALIKASPGSMDPSRRGCVVKNTDEVYAQARALAGMLGERRSEEYSDWIRVGLCLHNIDNRLLCAWDDLSRRSDKYVPGNCDAFWGSFLYRPDGLGIASLHLWAREDSPAEYEQFMRKYVTARVQRAITGTHHDVANVVASMYDKRFVCVSIKNNTWYEFRGHRWVYCDSGYSLRKLLSVDVAGRFVAESAAFGGLVANFSADSADQGGRDRMGQTSGGRRGGGGHGAQGGHGDGASPLEIDVGARDAAVQQESTHNQATKDSAKMIEIATKLKISSFKDAVMKESREIMYRENFIADLDSKPHLIGFDNGIYDLASGEFRDGSPEDMVSFSTRTSYVDYDPECDDVREIRRFFEQVQPEPRVREYLLRLFGSFINGSIREERFHFFTGVGCNGKSVTVDLFERAMGDYCCKLPVSLLTQKRAASNAASSEIARLKGKRFACLQEPGNEEVLNVGLMKELTGGDRIMARALYQEPIEFRPAFKMAMICNNLPEVRSDDGGTWRRIKCVKFCSRFVESPDPAKPEEFPLDTRLTDKLDRWAPHMMALLIHYYGVYMASGNPEPEEVSEGTRRYRQNSDGMQMFIDQYMVVDRDESCCADTVFKLFKEFAAHNGLKNCVPGKKPDVMEAMVRHLDGFLLPGGRTLQGARLKDDDELAGAPLPGSGASRASSSRSSSSRPSDTGKAETAGVADRVAVPGAPADDGKAVGQSFFRKALFDSLGG
jgi:P4 family phage/plasmid primase-like protien